MKRQMAVVFVGESNKAFRRPGTDLSASRALMYSCVVSWEEGEILRDELGLRVEHFNAEPDPIVREQLLGRIRHLRDVLGEKGRP